MNPEIRSSSRLGELRNKKRTEQNDVAEVVKEQKYQQIVDLDASGCVCVCVRARICAHLVLCLNNFR